MIFSRRIESVWATFEIISGFPMIDSLGISGNQKFSPNVTYLLALGQRRILHAQSILTLCRRAAKSLSAVKNDVPSGSKGLNRRAW
jgi:hypothetical protein